MRTNHSAHLAPKVTSPVQPHHPTKLHHWQPPTTKMRPPTSLIRARLCSVCSLRLLPRPTSRLQPQLTRTLATTPRLLAAPVSTPPKSPYSEKTTKSLPDLTAAIESRLLNPLTPPPSESEVITALKAAIAFAKQRLSSTTTPTGTPASALLSSLDTKQQPASTQAVRKVLPQQNSTSPRLKRAEKGQFDDLSSLVFRLLNDPRVFITPDILRTFLALQRLTRDPTIIPAVFALYANKAVLPPSGRGPARKPNPKAAKSAIPPSAAHAALEIAMDAGDITAALDVIDTSYAAPAFRRNKVIRKVLPWAGVGAITPGALWVLAEQLAGLQDTVPQETAVAYAFGGLMAYAGISTGMGMLAIGTANDQMERVTWVPGTPLRERWLREEERAALDAVAMAWGFQDEARRGEEEGEEWELLKEVAGRKGMVVDAPNLLKHME
jgi:hypothetical protein